MTDFALPAEAGWPLAEARNRGFEVAGMPNAGRQGLRRLRPVGRRRAADAEGDADDIFDILKAVRANAAPGAAA